MRAARIAFACAAALAVAACANDQRTMFQGWIEAELIFVGPYEAGRIETLTVREGDQVEAGELLFTVDDDLRRADVAMQEAAVKNAQVAFDRAKQLLRTQTGTQRALDDAEAALRTAQARLNSAQTRLERRKVASPVTGSVQQIYYRVGELVLREPWVGMTNGLWKDPERYEETYWSRFADTWVHGDYAEIDHDGYWYIRGRSDDTLKVAGKRIGPAEVESAAVAHPLVREAAAIGVPHETKGDVIVVFAIAVPNADLATTS